MRLSSIAVMGDAIARWAKAVAVERGADAAAVGESDRGRTVPRFHQRGVIFVEGLPLLAHQRVAGPGLRNHHHRRMRQRVAAAGQEFERVVEAGGIGLAFIGDRPELLDIVAIELGRNARLPRRHPVDVAADGVDLAVMGDHPIRMGQPPGREGVGREALMYQRQRRLETRVLQVLVVGAELVSEEHPLIDDGAAGEGGEIELRLEAAELLDDPPRRPLAHDVEAPLERVFVVAIGRPADKDLAMKRFGSDDDRRQAGIVDRNVAPAENVHAFVGDGPLERRCHRLPHLVVLREEDHADGVVAGRRQGEAQPLRLFGEKAVRQLRQHAGAVADQRIGAGGAAMGQILDDLQAVGDDLMRFLVRQIGDETDAAGILSPCRVVETLRARRQRRTLRLALRARKLPLR
jgi:hypothetical protein